MRRSFIIMLMLTPFGFLLTSIGAYASRVAYYSMELTGDCITEEVGGAQYIVRGALPPLNVAGACGNGLRLDGYSSYVEAGLPSSIGTTVTSMTISLWCVVETYPIMAIDTKTTEKALIAGNIDDTANTGFAFYLGRDGKYSFECYSAGWKVTCEASGKMPCYKWNHLVATADCTNRIINFYNNGELVASSRCLENISMGNHSLMIGRATVAIYDGPFMLNTINGIIDEFELYDDLIADDLPLVQAENEADLAYPISRYADDIMRPLFHGMPSGNWTNECHGLVEYDGQYHLFFQKNGNGPYMSRLQWGHLVSDDLIHWEEMPIVLFTDESYDIKGCWSGCVFTDEELTNSKPNIFYTAVDYEKATIAQALADDNSLLEWTKLSTNPIIDGRPNGLSDDFRDCDVFKADNGNYYIIVGTSKNDLGATTLHSYDSTTKTWSNDGTIFFSALSNISGRFWEMPTIDKIGDKWIFTTTPLETTQGVETQYWVGDINTDGTFSPNSTTPGKVELEGMSHDGYGMLSPAIAECDGKTIAIGIVPDKLSEEYNYELGYAHTYSLPREWSIDSNNQLVQTPFEGLSSLRTDINYQETETSLNGMRNLGEVEGRMVEVEGEFVVSISAQKVGFRLLDDDDNALEVYYSQAENKIVVDMRALSRWVNDTGVYDGLYESALPSLLSTGSTVKIHVFFDHSILDVFVNDTWAFSTRVFATNADAQGVKVFSEGSVAINKVNAWVLNPNMNDAMAIEDHHIGEPTVLFRDGNIILEALEKGSLVRVYNEKGVLLETLKYDGYSSIPIHYNGIIIVKISNGKSVFVRKWLAS